MATKTRELTDCRTSREFIRYAEHNGGWVDRQAGSHAIVKAPGGGTCPVPMHNGDIPTGTRCSIIKRFRIIGLGLLLMLCAGSGIVQAIVERLQ